MIFYNGNKGLGWFYSDTTGKQAKRYTPAPLP
jgi:hypothetical protein